MNIDLSNMTPPHKRLIKFLMFASGCIIFSSYAILLKPNDIGSGGVLGISLIIDKLFGINLGLTTLIVNIPLFIFGFKLLGRSFALKSATIVIISSFLIDYIPTVIELGPLGDKLTATIFCGVLSGASMALIFMGGGSTGGLDISGKIFNKAFKSIQLSHILLFQDLIVYLIMSLTLGLDYVVYAVILSFIRSKTIETIHHFFAASKQCIIISSKDKELTDAIAKGMGRGVTVLDAIGAYSNTDKNFIYLVIQTNEIILLREIVNEVDPHAFITVSEVKNIYGNFKEHSLSI